MCPQEKRSSGGAVASRTGGVYIPGAHHSEVGFLEQDAMHYQARVQIGTRVAALGTEQVHGLISMDFAIARIAP